MVAAALAWHPFFAEAATVTWDANTTISGAQDGSGIWSTSAGNWWDGTSDVTWPNTFSDAAVVGAGSGTAGTITVSALVNVNSITFNPPGAGTYTVSSGTLLLGGTTPTITQNVAAGSTISSVLAGSAGLSTVVTNPASSAGLSLSGSNTYSGTTIVGGTGRTALFNLNALGANGNGNETVVTNGATLALAVTGSYAPEALVLNGAGTSNSGALRFSIGSTVWTGSIRLGSNSSIVGAAASASITGNIDLAGFTLTRSTGGTVQGDLWSGVVSSTGGGGNIGFSGGGSTAAFTMTGANTYSGTTTVGDATKLTISSAVPTASGDQTISSNGLGTSSVVLAGGSVSPATLALKNNGDGTTGAQVLTLGNNVTVTNSKGAIFDVGNTNGTVLVNNTSTSTGATAANKTIVLGNLTIGNQASGTSNVVNVTGSNGYSLAFGQTVMTVSTTFNTNANLALGAVSQSGGTRALAKTGTSTLTLGGANTYTGVTTVTAGTLLINGNSSAATGAVSVNSGATLGGTGTVGGATMIDGTLTPGADRGVITFANGLSLGTNSSTVFDLAGASRGTNYDGVDLTAGTLSYGGFITLNITTTLANGTYDLFNALTVSGDVSGVTLAGGLYTGSFNETSAGVWTATLTSGQGQSIVFATSTGDVSVVPEPSSAFLFIGGLGFAAFRLRKRIGR